MPEARIHPATSIGPVHLTVRDLARGVEFYREGLGFQIARRDERVAVLGAGGPELLVLHESAGAARPSRATGLYHFAILVPSRASLAAALAHMSEAGVRLDGASDHSVSEALYLSDPEVNGIEVYRDRPRNEWPISEGRVRMGSAPIDLDALLAEPGGCEARGAGLPADTRIGHIHLAVADLEASRHFYIDVLGFDETGRYGSGALFVSAGGYHHHVAANIWETAGAPPAPEGAAGLEHFTIRVPDAAERDRVAARLNAAGIPFERTEEGVLAKDPAGIGVMIGA